MNLNQLIIEEAACSFSFSFAYKYDTNAFMLTVCWLRVDYVLTMCWLRVDYMLTVSWLHVECVLATISEAAWPVAQHCRCGGPAATRDGGIFDTSETKRNHHGPMTIASSLYRPNAATSQA